MAWGSAAEVETRKRILLAVAAYAYEVLNEPLCSDADFDGSCREIDLNQDTGNAALDAWWRASFDPSTGMWIHIHPDLPGLARIARMILGETR